MTSADRIARAVALTTTHAAMPTRTPEQRQARFVFFHEWVIPTRMRLSRAEYEAYLTEIARTWRAARFGEVAA